MKSKIQLPKTIIKSLKAGPFQQYIDGFILFLDGKGFSNQYIPRRLGLINDLSKWIMVKKINIEELDEKLINEFIDQKKKIYFCRPRCSQKNIKVVY